MDYLYVTAKQEAEVTKKLGSFLCKGEIGMGSKSGPNIQQVCQLSMTNPGAISKQNLFSSYAMPL